MNGRPHKASPLTDGKSAMIEMGWSPFVTTEEYASTHVAISGVGCHATFLRLGRFGRGGCSQCRLDAYLEIAINLWDVAAALVLLTKQGL